MGYKISITLEGANLAELKESFQQAEAELEGIASGNGAAPTSIEEGKRKRRTKAEMEADAAKSQSAAPAGGGAPTVAPTTPANYQLVLDAMTKYVQSFPDGQAGYDAGSAVLKEFGVDKCSSLKPDQWPAILARLTKPAAGPTASSLLG